MNRTIFWRLVWKEYRQQRSLLIAIVLIAMVLFGIMFVAAALQNQPPGVSSMYVVALMMPIFYALGCGATLFAGEHERETFDFLSALPHASREVFWAKVLVAVSSCVALMGLLALAALVVTGARPVESTVEPLQALVYLGTTVLVLNWTIFYSLLLRNPLWAVAAAGLSFFASLIVFSLLFAILGRDHPLNQTARVAAITIVGISQVLLFVGLLAINTWLGNRWLTTAGARARVISAGSSAEQSIQTVWPASSATYTGRLLWQSLRESGYLVIACYGVILLSCLFLVTNGLTWMFTAAMLPGLIASFTFFNDQWKQHYRFFAERGVRPGTLWLRRVSASFIACLPWLGFIVIAMALDRGERGWRMTHQGYSWQTPEYHWPYDFLALGVLYFAWCQWCSLIFRAGILGVFVGLSVSVFLTFGVGLLRFLGIPDWLGIYSLAGILLAASWYRASDWLVERDTLRRWAGYVAGVLLLIGVYLAAMATHRAYEIPDLALSAVSVPGPANTSIPASIAQQHAAALAELMRPATAEELETAQQYRAVWSELRSLPSPILASEGPPMMGGMSSGGGGAAMGASGNVEQTAEFNSQRQEKLTQLVQRFIETSRRGDADFAPDILANPNLEDASLPLYLAMYVFEEADRLRKREESESELECYLSLLRFAYHFQQRNDSQQILAATGVEKQVDERLVEWAAHTNQARTRELWKTLQQLPYSYAADYDIARLRAYSTVKALVEVNQRAWEAQYARDTLTPELLRWLPWEQIRAERWLNYQAMTGSVNSMHPSQQKWFNNTLLGAYWVPANHWIAAYKTKHLTDRAARDVRLQLIIWHYEHGELPESLAELEQSFPGEVPLDPSTKRTWVYRPQGVARPAGTHAELTMEALPPNTPFLWTSGVDGRNWMGAPTPSPPPAPIPAGVDSPESAMTPAAARQGSSNAPGYPDRSMFEFGTIYRIYVPGME